MKKYNSRSPYCVVYVTIIIIHFLRFLKLQLFLYPGKEDLQENISINLIELKQAVTEIIQMLANGLLNT